MAKFDVIYTCLKKIKLNNKISKLLKIQITWLDI